MNGYQDTGIAFGVGEIRHKIDSYMGPGPSWDGQWQELAYREVSGRL